MQTAAPNQARREALVIMAKHPRLGAVKTRMARHVGDERAFQLYLGFLRDLEAKFAGRERPLLWAYTPAESDFPSLVNSGSRCFPQEGERLGARLLNGFQRLFGEGYERVVFMSSDSPQLPAAWIDEAFAALRGVDVVFAPAEDGGYNLVGLRELHDLFTGVEMSTPRVLADTLERVRTLGLASRLLPVSFDVDEIEDVEKLRGFLAQDAECLPHTRRVLEQSWRD